MASYPEGHPLLGALDRALSRPHRPAMDSLERRGQPMSSEVTLPAPEVSRLRTLQALGTLCAFAAEALLEAAEAPAKLETIGVSPLVISLIMAVGVFLARLSVPALIRGRRTFAPT